MDRPTLRVFISSPGDVAEERRIVAAAVERLRRRYAPACDLIEYRWENDVFLATDGGFQEQIARTSDFDVVVFILWSRLGTKLPPAFARPDGTHYQSGTEFEFEDAIEASRQRGRPHVILFRKSRKCVLDLSDDAEAVRARLEQYRALESFINTRLKSSSGEFLHAFNEFDAADELEAKVTQKLDQVIVRLLEAHDALPPEAPADGAPGRAGQSPFRGLARFEPEDTDLYFGRRRAVQDVLEQLRARAAGGNPFVLVFGSSGVGKSSFARAGLLPFLIDPGVIIDTRAWRWSIFEPSDSTGDLVDGLAASLLTTPGLPNLARRMSETELARAIRGREGSLIPLLRDELLEHGGITDGPPPQANGSAGASFPVRYALLIDPVEEIFTRQGATAEDRERFLVSLGWLLGTGLFWVVGTMRSDFFDRCAEHRALIDLKHGNGQYHLPPPSHAELAQMIRLPAQAAGLRFEVDRERGPLDEHLLEEASRDPGTLPLLEFTLDEVWKKSDAGRTGRLTFKAFDELGGIRGAINSRAKEVLGDVRARLGDRTDKAVQKVFGMLVGIGDRADHTVVRLYAPLSHFDADPEQKTVVEALVEARLFVTDIDDENNPVVTLGHESLLRHWPELVQWVESNREFLMLRERIDRAADQWKDNDRHADYLLGEGRPLIEGRHLLTHNRDGMTALQIEFVERSIKADADRLRLRVRRQRRVTLLALALALVTTAGFVVSLYLRKQAVQQRQTAASRARLKHDLVTSMLNDVRENISPTEPKDAALMAKLSERVTAHYERLRLEGDSDEVRQQESANLMSLCRSFAKMRDYDRAARLAEEVVRIRTDISGAEDPSLAEALLELGRARNQMSDYAAADAAYERAIKVLEGKVQPGDTSTEAAGWNATLVALYGSRGELCRHLGRYAEARSLQTKALAMAQSDPAEYARRLNDLGELCRNLREFDQADKYLLDAQARAEQVIAQDKALRPEVTSNLGVLRYDQKRLPEAESLLRKAMDMDIQALGSVHAIVAADKYKLARVALADGRIDEAAKLIKESEAVLDDKAGRQKARLAKCLEVKADVLLAQKNTAEAEKAALKVQEIRTALFVRPHPDLARTYEQLAAIRAAAGRTAEADAARKSADEMQRELRARDAEFVRRAQGGK